ncbi:MAG: S41 family peptidase, partial [Candidatus Omnitrophica bacterium]|nr:S41 family peptidase [Candidatus Omnitrophota bacterium]
MRRRLWLAGLLLSCGVALVQVVPLAAKGATASESTTNDAFYKELDLVDQTLNIVRSNYVEEPKAKELVYGALKGMLGTLDPYSQFLDPDSYNELKVDTEGEFGGLGIEITIKDDLLTIITPIDDTPAYRVGLKAGDHIVKIDGGLTRGITLLEAVKKLRGKPHTTVILTIFREGESELKEFTLERAIITIQSVREATLLDNHIGYIRLSDFREKSADDLETALKQLKDQAMESLILDLRNNPGGLLDVAVSVAQLFLHRDQLIVTTKGRLRNQNQELRARAEGLASELPLVVLINEGSASASEIVAGAIQDYHRGVLIGTKSHGKASVQTIFPLKDGSALRLTTSKYFTPSGRSIHGQGIPPDVEVPFVKLVEEKSKEEKSKELFDRINADEPVGEKPAEGAAAAKPAESTADRLRADNQLARAVD